MFDEEFYPTPDYVIRKMITPFGRELKNKNILEPSAGSGNILDYICKNNMYEACGVSKQKVYAIEKNGDLTYILQGKGYRILANDFLAYKPVHSFDLILMNPPFSNGDEHLLHAWEIMHKGDIVCLLNAETINNAYTKRRQLLSEIIAQNGNVEMLDNCFSRADRKTDVNVALVRLHKDSSDERFRIDFDNACKSEKPNFAEEVVAGNELAINDKLGAYLHAWEKTQDACVEFIKARKKLEFYATAFMPIKEIVEIVNASSTLSHEKENEMETAYNEFINIAKSKAWKEIIQNIGMDKFMTANMRKSFDEFCVSQGAYELNRENIFNLIRFICMNSATIMNKAVADVYDIFIRFFDGNAIHTEGWKTNSSWKVNRKVILPYFVEWSYSSTYKANYHRWDEYRDIDKVMCYLSGIPYESLDKLKPGISEYNSREHTADSYEHLSLQRAIQFVRVGDNSLHESEFFQFRCYKKGTLHIIFKDEDLWARFNIAASEGKKILGSK